MDQTPPPSSHKRQRTDAGLDFSAILHSYKESKKGTVTKAQKRFTSKVLKVLDGDKVDGKYISIMTISLSLKTKNVWEVIEQGDLGQILSFFQPKQFLDAQAILFNKKGAFDATLTQPAVGWGSLTGNLTELQTVRVKDSTVFMSFKSNSTMKMILEIYEIQGESGLNLPPATLFSTIWNQYALNTLDDSTQTTNVVIRPLCTSLNAAITHLPALLQDYKIKKTVIKFQPGEEATHTMQGPKNYTMKPSNKIMSDGTYANWSTKGSGTHVMFRVTTDINMGYYNGSGPIANSPNVNLQNNGYHIAHHANTILGTDTNGGPGGILCELKRYYKIEQPEGTRTDAQAINFQPTVCIFNNYGTLDTTGLQVSNYVPGTNNGQETTRN